MLFFSGAHHCFRRRAQIKQLEHRKSCFVHSPLAFPSSTVAKSSYYFKYREEPIPYLDQATRKNTCQIFLPKNIPESKISNPKNRDTWSPVYPPPGQLSFQCLGHLWFGFHTGYLRTSKGSKHQFLCNVQDGLVDAPSFALCHRIYLPRNFSYYDVRRCRVSSRLPTQTTPNLRCIRG